MTQKEFLDETVENNDEFWAAVTEKEYFDDFKENVKVICTFSKVQTLVKSPDKHNRTHQLKADVEHNGKVKKFSTRSKRLITALKPYLRNLEPDESISLAVTQIGKDENVQYLVEAIE